MRSMLRSKESLIFGLIGSLTGGIGILIHSLLIGPLVEGTLSATQFPSPFFSIFGLIACTLGLYYAVKRPVLQNSYLNLLLMIVVFVLCGLAYSFWLNRSQDPSSETFSLPFAPWIVSVAVGLFVFIFCTTFLALPNNQDAVLRSPLLALVIPVLFFFGLFLDVSAIVSLGLVCCLLVLTLVYITIEYHLHEYFNNIVVNILIFMLAISIIPTFGIILLPISNIYFLLGIIPATMTLKKSAVSGPIFQQRITITFEWILALPSVLLNYTVIGSFFSILPYLGIMQHLRDTQQLTRTNSVRSYLLGFFAFLVHLLFFIYYESVRHLLSTANAAILLLDDVLAWSIISLIGSLAIGYSLFGLKNES